MIIALDQALNVTGYSKFDDKGNLITHGKYTTSGSSQIEKVIELKKWLIEELLKDCDLNKDTVVLEGVQLQQIPGTNREGNVDTFKILAIVQGVLMITLVENGAKDVKVVFASEWKSTCGVKGKNRAEQKRNAQAYVLSSFGIKATQDECDAICIGKHIVEQNNSVVNWG